MKQMEEREKTAQQEEVLPEEEREEMKECCDAEESDAVECDPLARAQDQIEQLQGQLATEQEKALRQMAEFDNFRKRTQREKQESYQNALAACVLEFLPVLDNLERALQAAQDGDPLKDGVSLTVTQFRDLLAKLGVSEIAALGEEFDPVWHNAVNQIEDDSYGENEICEVFQKGYRMGERTIRHAMVAVANP